MKKFWLLTGVVLLWQCGPKEIPQAGNQLPEQEFQLQPHQTVPLRGKDKNASGEITFVQLQDSRCPANAMCIRQGAAITTFRVTLPGAKEPWIVRLFIGDFMADDPRNKRNLTADTATVTTEKNTQYQLILKQVTSYPGTGTENPQAIIQLNKH